MNGRIKTVDIMEAQEQLSKLIQEVEQDDVIICIMRGGSPVAVLKRKDDGREFVEAKKKAIHEMKRLHRRGMRLGLGPFNRDNLHDRHK